MKVPRIYRLSALFVMLFVIGALAEHGFPAPPSGLHPLGWFIVEVVALAIAFVLFYYFVDKDLINEDKPPL